MLPPPLLELIQCQLLNLVNYIASNTSQLLFLAVLVYVTVFRRQISCNSDYSYDLSQPLRQETKSELNNLRSSSGAGTSSDCNDYAGSSVGDTGNNVTEGNIGNNNNTDSNSNDDKSGLTFESTILGISNQSHGEYHRAGISTSTTDAAIPAVATNNSPFESKKDGTSMAQLLISLSSSQSPLFFQLSSDLQFQCLTYLHPRDVVSFSCCNRLSRFLIDNYRYDPVGTTTGTTTTATLITRNVKRFGFGSVLSSSSSLPSNECTKSEEQEEKNEGMETVEEICSFSDTLWLHLWNRDYAWILYSWDIGRGAAMRSIAKCISSDMESSCSESVSNPNSNIMWNSCAKSILLPRTLLLSLPDCVFPESLTKQQALDAININHNITNSNDTTSPLSAAATATSLTMKEFYFTFSQTWLNYTIAGHSTFDSCLTGIHGHVFNITNFLDDHPGSPESIILQGGGRDSTSFFEGVGHSMTARKVAVRKLVEVVDLGCCSGAGDVGLYDFQCEEQWQERGRRRRRSVSLDGIGTGAGTGIGTGSSSPNSLHWPLVGLKSTPPSNVSLLPRNRSRPMRNMGTLSKTQHMLKMGEKTAKADAARMVKRLKGQIVGKVNVYYDPLDGHWHGWYLNSNFDPVFVNNLQAS